MKVKCTATFQELEIATMAIKTWEETCVIDIELPNNFNERHLRSVIEGTDDEFLKSYEDLFKSSISTSYQYRRLFTDKLPQNYKSNAIRVVADFTISTDLKLVLWNFYGKINDSYRDNTMIFIKDNSLKKIC